ncbi:ATP-binding cassette domain-containing protein [Agreia bicolorata]|uniref:ATP-binding cassette domain-containing protein n=1 Tax=Agreia bicolorata TaxID=110935 RepID=UPI0005CAE8E0|nr:ATP-binding cassette domain-containing protein [Agreia bicolorata]
MTALLEVNELTVSYSSGSALLGRGRSSRVVDGVSFEVGESTTFGLVGESGAGKSTVGNAILGLAPISAGSVVFDGVDISSFGRRMPLWYRKAVQVVFQDPLASLNPRMTVRTSLRHVLTRHWPSLKRAAVDARIDDLLDRVGLQPHHADRFPRQLSGGQCQRVAIARAIAVEPRLIVCDEAVSALDVSTQAQVMNLLAKLQRDMGISYLFVAHDLEVVRHISNHVGVMYKGSMVESGPVDEVYENPSQDYTRTLLSATLVPDPAVQRLRREARTGRVHALSGTGAELTPEL